MDAEPKVPVRQQALGEALAAYLMSEAASQYMQKLYASLGLNLHHKDYDALGVAIKALSAGGTLALRRMGRAMKRMEPGKERSPEDRARWDRYIAQLAHLHLEAGSN